MRGVGYLSWLRLVRAIKSGCEAFGGSFHANLIRKEGSGFGAALSRICGEALKTSRVTPTWLLESLDHVGDRTLCLAYKSLDSLRSWQ